MATSTPDDAVPRLPYSMFVGQDDLKLALKLSHIESRIGGVLISGERGTGKSTLVRAFTEMAQDRPMVTLPINATEDRVVGGWRLSKAGDGKQEMNVGDGLLVQANGTVLYVDEVNLLEDHIVNLILDPAAGGRLALERDGIHRPELQTRFTLVGTMNPEEGTLRPQLLDRFGLMVRPKKLSSADVRRQVLETVIVGQVDKNRLDEARKADQTERDNLAYAKDHLKESALAGEILDACAQLAHDHSAEGSRAEIVMALAARAHAAYRRAAKVGVEDVAAVAPMALIHRRKVGGRATLDWGESDTSAIKKTLERFARA